MPVKKPKMRAILLVLLFATGLLCATCEKVRYDNYRLYKVFIDSEDQLKALQTLQEKEYASMEFWKDPIEIGDDSVIMVSPENVGTLENFVDQYGMKSNLTIPDIQKVIDAQSRKFKSKSSLEWTDYHTLDEIYEWLDKISEKFPKQVTPFEIGKSYEGRIIRGVKISYKKGNRGIFIEANMHAREWISSATITWVINQLLTSTDPSVRDLAENIDWYIVPVLNPDGFVYSHEKNRMWRKTRQPHGNGCYGADPNRNFDFLWLAAGASTDPCSETYAGPKPNSEPEIQALINFFDTIANKINVYISLHSFGQLVLSPWGHTNTEFPKNYDDMLKVAKGYADAVKVKFGTQYRYGSSATVLYKVSGSSKEWAYGAKGIPITYTIELRDKGLHGFILPPEQIIPTAKEVLDGFKGLVAAARKLSYL